MVVTHRAEPPAGPLRRNRDFNLLWIGQAASMLGARVTEIATPLLVLQVFHSPALAGALVFVAVFPAAAIQLFAGVWVDRSDRRIVMVATDTFRALAFVSLVAALLLGELTVYHLLAVLLVNSIATVFFGLAERSALPLVIRKDQYTAAFGLNEVRFRSATLIGPLIAGTLFTIASAVPFIFNAATSALSAVTSAFVRGPLRSPQESEKKNIWADLHTGAQWLRQHPFYLWTMVMIGATNVIGVGFPIAAIVRLESLGATPVEIGFALGAFGVGGLIGAAFASRVAEKVSVSAVVLTTRWVIASFLVLASFADNVLLLALCLPPISVIAAQSNVSLSAARMRDTPADLRARVDSVWSLACNTLAPVGALLAGVGSAALGPSGGLLLLALVVVTIAITFTVTPAVRRGESAPQPATKR